MVKEKNQQFADLPCESLHNLTLACHPLTIISQIQKIHFLSLRQDKTMYGTLILDKSVCTSKVKRKMPG